VSGSTGEITPRTSLIEAQLLATFLDRCCLTRSLEIGVGDGRLLLPLSRRSGESIGIDIDRTRLEVLRARFGREGTRAGLVRADVRSLPFSDRAFTTILLIRILHRFPSIGPLLAEVRRVLRDDGTLVVSAVTRPSFRTVGWDLSATLGAAPSPERVTLSKGPVTAIHSRTAPGYLLTRSAVLSALRSAGFTVVRTVGTGWNDLPLFRTLPAKTCLTLDGLLSQSPLAPTYFFVAQPGPTIER
jgi:SAM-dependent methyltransferase